MQTASSGFAAGMLLPDQIVEQRILLTLPAFQSDGVTAIPSSYADVSSCVVSIQGDIAATTTVPEGTLLINGYSAAAATIALMGPLKQAPGVQSVDGQTVYWLCNPNDPTSPMYRLPKVGMQVVLQEGRWVSGAIEWITVGTLIVDTCATSNGTVTLTLIDGRNSIRGPAALPPVVTFPPENAGLTSEFPVEYLFRYASPGQYLSRPATRPNCVLAVGFRTSIWPDVGSLSPAVQSIGNPPPPFIPGLWGSAISNTEETAYPYTPKGGSVPAGTPVFFEWWNTGINTFSIEVSSGLLPNWALLADITPTGIHVFTFSNSGNSTGFTKTCDTTSTHYFGVLFDTTVGSATVSGKIYYDNTTTTFSFSALDVRTSDPFDEIDFNGFGDIGGSTEAWQVTTEAIPASNYGFTPTLILDPSLNPLTALPDTSQQDVWAALQDIAAAEAAVINIDELNIAHFTNRNSIAAKTSTLTVSSRVNLTALDSLEQLSTVATHVQVPVNPLGIIAPTGIWGASTALQVAGTLTFIATTESPVVNISTPDAGFFPASGATAGATYWRGDTQADGNGIEINTGISIAIVQLSSNSLQVTVTNANPFPVWLVNPLAFGTTDFPAGSPAIFIGGQAIISTVPALDGSSSPGTLTADAQYPAGNAKGNTQWGEILLPIPANNWIQDLTAAQTLADHYLRDFISPRPLLRNFSMISDPRTQLLDRITITDPDVSQINADALIVGIHFQLGGGQGLWTRALDLRMWNPPGAWILGVSRLGVDTVLI